MRSSASSKAKRSIECKAVFKVRQIVPPVARLRPNKPIPIQKLALFCLVHYLLLTQTHLRVSAFAYHQFSNFIGIHCQHTFFCNLQALLYLCKSYSLKKRVLQVACELFSVIRDFFYLFTKLRFLIFDLFDSFVIKEIESCFRSHRFSYLFLNK